ncbi:MAG: nuclear transport factor 2 family protein [Cyclobacteriaceae bacterium]|nr:nuclear transport factor 2 family protein [Cyclobacteriaceae bacterium]
MDVLPADTPNLTIMLNSLTLIIALTVSFLALQLSGQDLETHQPIVISPKPITTTGLLNFSHNKQKRWISIDEVLVETFNLALTPMEEQLAKAESGEIKALVKRDTSALKNIWLQDFSLDESHNKVHHNQNPLPHYLSLHRRIEKILITGDHVYVSGIEYAVQVQDNRHVNTQVARKYTHLWIKELFGWRLATKNYN